MLDKQIIQAWLEEFVIEFFKTRYQLQYTDFILTETGNTFYIKFKDQLHPTVFIQDNCYQFNKHIIVVSPLIDIYSKTSKMDLYKYIHMLLEHSKAYTNYLTRLDNVKT